MNTFLLISYASVWIVIWLEMSCKTLYSFCNDLNCKKNRNEYVKKAKGVQYGYTSLLSMYKSVVYWNIVHAFNRAFSLLVQ